METMKILEESEEKPRSTRVAVPPIICIGCVFVSLFLCLCPPPCDFIILKTYIDDFGQDGSVGVKNEVKMVNEGVGPTHDVAMKVGHAMEPT
jgi:hypothetical protein